MTDAPERDPVTGRSTTGHEWDGIRELNTPLPKWWLYTWLASIVFAIGYCVLFPAIPFLHHHTNGLLGYSTRTTLTRDLAAAAAAQSTMRRRIAAASLAAIRRDPELFAFAQAGGAAAFADNCVPCHRAGGAGAPGFPNLTDDVWLWGGTLAEIQQTITHGVRNADPDSRQSAMPRFGLDGMLQPEQIDAVADYVLSLRRKQPIAGEGAKVFAVELRRLPRRPRSGQARGRRPAARYADLALRQRQARRDRRRHPGAQQLDAGLGRTPRSGHHQDAGGLRPCARRRRVMPLDLPRSPNPSPLPHAGEGRVGGPDAAEDRLYASRVRVYPRAVTGPVRRIKWAVLVLCLAVYYLAPWLRWDRGPGHPHQALLIDLPNRRGYFFAIEIWPQEVYYLAGLMILAAIALFFVTSLFGRLWCGYACPQTVWTDLFMLTERLIEGDRAVRMMRDRGRWTFRKLARKVLKHAVWVVIAALTGGAWVMYFYDAPTLVHDLVHLRPSPTAVFFIGLFTTTTYLLAGWAREQVCTFMCPWPRFQSAMVDRNTLTVMYRAWRGEPRGKIRKGGLLQPQHGDCIDCHSCVHVCPTGIDIRDGLQLQCIGCGLCIDACDEVMVRLGRPKGLIAFTSQAMREAAISATKSARGDVSHALRAALLRPRTVVYSVILLVGTAGLLWSLLARSDFALSVLADRSPLYVQLSDGSIRNAYTVKILNKDTRERRYLLSVAGLPGARLAIAGDDNSSAAAEGVALAVQPDSVGTFRTFLHALPGTVHGEAPITFAARPSDGREPPVTHPAEFHAPPR